MGEDHDRDLSDAEELARSLEEALGQDPDLGPLALLHDKARGLEGRVEAVKKELSLKITAKMEAMGLDSVKADGRRLSFRTQKYFGVAEGREGDLKDFIEAVAPEVNIPASANIKKALDAWLDRNPGQPVPDFISVSETRSLVNAKA